MFDVRVRDACYPSKSLLEAYAGKAALVYVDPPFNQGVRYLDYQDTLTDTQYAAFAASLLDAAIAFMTLNARIIVCTPPRWSAHYAMLLAEIGEYESKIIWHRTFGQYHKTQWGSCFTELLVYRVGDPPNNIGSIRVQSRRQQMGDRRADPDGRVPGDVWSIPQVCGTFGERVEGAPCQQPVELVERVILAYTNPGDLVYDPCCCTGTTGVAAIRHGRRFVGTDISGDYVAKANERLAAEVGSMKGSNDATS